MKRYVSLIFAIAALVNLHAQPGIRICHFNSDAPDDFSFVSNEHILPGTQVFFSDQNWSSSNKHFAEGQEGILKWETSASIDAGTVVHIEGRGEASAGTLSVVKTGFNLANKSDVLWAFCIKADTICPMTAISNTATLSDTTFLHSGLSASEIGIFMCDNAIYTGSRSMTESSWQNFYNADNWTLTSGTNSQHIGADMAPFILPPPLVTDPDTTADLLENYPRGWIGDTASYGMPSSSLTKVLQTKFATVMHTLAGIDLIDLHLDPWDFEMTSQNNYGIILTSSQMVTENIGQANWNGYYLQITASSGVTTVKLFRHKENTNSAALPFWEIDREKMADGIDFSFSYLSNGKIAYRISYGAEPNSSIASGETDPLFMENNYFGIYTNLKPNAGTNISVRNIIAKTANSTYKLINPADMSNPLNWEPARELPLRSDKLIIADGDAVTLKESMEIQALTVTRSHLTLENGSKKDDIALYINGQLMIDPASSITFTNSKTGTKSAEISIADGADAHIAGSIILDGKGYVPQHKLTARGNNPFVFAQGSRMIVLRQDRNPFKTNGIAPAAVFEPGAVYEQHEGESPLAWVGSTEVALFQQGAIYQYYGGGLSWSNSSYATMELYAERKTNILIGGDIGCSVHNLKIFKGTYTFGLQANNKPIHITVADSLLIADGCKIIFAPVNEDAHSIFTINGTSAKGKGILDIGTNAELRIGSRRIDWQLNSTIDGTLRLGDQSVVMLDSSIMEVSGSIINAGARSYISTPENIGNQTAYLVRPVAGASSQVLFPVGTASYGYMPMTISNNMGAAAMFKVRCFEGLYQNGLYGDENYDADRLNCTWEITPDASAVVDIEIAWNGLAERDGYYRQESRMIINHHRPGNDNWQVLENSGFSQSDALYRCKSLAVSDFSTVSAEGSSVPLALYFRDFKAQYRQSKIDAEWLQTIPVDSVGLLVSADAVTYRLASTVHFAGIGMHRLACTPIDGPENYLKMQHFCNGKMVEESETIAVRCSGEKLANLQMEVYRHFVKICKAAHEPVRIRIIATNGILIEEIIISDDAECVDYQWPSSCDHCIIHAESSSGSATAMLPNRE